MASRTQLRLGQITGSFGNREGGIIDSQAQSNATSLATYNATSGSMVGIMSDIASSLLRIHGDNIFASNAVSTLKDLDGNTRITYVADGKLLLSGSGTGADAVDIDAPQGGIDIDAVEGISITQAASGDGKDLIIEQTGANDSGVHITAAGNGSDAIKIDATAGSMQIGPTLADGQTLKLGKNGAVEVEIAPHGTAANEKFIVTNTSGDAADAIKLLASAGGIDIDCI